MKRIILLIGMVAALLLLGACGSSDTETAGGSPGDAPESAVAEGQTADWAKEYAAVLQDTTLLDDPSRAKEGCDTEYLASYFKADYYYDKYTLCDVNDDGIPELFLFLPTENEADDPMAVIVEYNGEVAQIIGYEQWAKYNRETQELIVHGHWHGAGGSGENEWHAYKLDGTELVPTMGIDYGSPDIEGYAVYTDEYADGQSKEAYDAEYDKHVKGAEDFSSFGRFELTDPEGFESFGGIPENFYAGEELEVYGPVIERIKNAVENTDSSVEDIPVDLSEMLMFEEMGAIEDEDDPTTCYYALWDMDGNGTREMIIGTYWDDEELGYGTIHPLGLYTIRDGKPHLFSELMYFENIIDRKWICTLQGNGIQEGHEDGFCFILDNGELKEVPVSDAEGEEKGFTWKRII